ncbi:cysteine protease [Conoideocrella luteorostrata]|uniref:Cysteine protease n=1 Tax=Conoideocrella luteorostrata TaxID=1105319 RepID=A0AAJ0D0A5_9HYPO|nr:cysteine protease [Conoideocrella luteorostrata]
MEREAQFEESLAAKSGGQDALKHAIKAAEMYMKASQEVIVKTDATRLRRKCEELINHAERLKAQIAETGPPGLPLSAGPPLHMSKAAHILIQASILHGNEFPPWDGDPLIDEFESSTAGNNGFIDNTKFTLSAAQINNFAAWVKPAQLFKPIETNDIKSFEDKMMQISDNSDLVQDVTTDCSVVASLSAALSVLVGKHAVLSSIFHPFNYRKGVPKFSRSGKYVMKLNFNGCARRVAIDDRLPMSRTDRTIFVVDRHNPYLLWPALLEKAYLKVRGGYDFPGSNSGTDLWVLIGWIPEQLFLQKEDVDIDDIWRRIKTAYDSQDVVVTLGTGRISADEEQVMGLIGEHDYAVESIVSSGGSRRLLIKNPWCDGPSMTTMGWSTFHPSGQTLSPQMSPVEGGLESPRSSSRFWVAFEDVAQHFESMYLNWNPCLFSHRLDYHFHWEVPPRVYKPSLLKNPQFLVVSPGCESIWILISRHFVDAELDIARGRGDSMAAVARQLGFMSILVFENSGHKVQISDGEIYRGPYVDSPQTLARLETQPGQLYTIVLDQHELPLPQYSFTMSVFSHCPLKMTEASETMSQISERNGAWTRRTAGGNSACATYFQNPQYSLYISKSTPVSILLSADMTDIHVHMDIVWAQGARVTAVRLKDLVASSGEYRRGCAVANIAMLEPGVYTLVCSTFDAGQLARFVLRVGSMAPIRVTPVPADGAGRLVTKVPRLSLLEGDMKYRLPVDASWLTRANVSIHSLDLSRPGGKIRPPASLTVRISVIHGWGPEQVTVAVSGENEFQDPAVTVRTPQFEMEPERIRREGLWMLIESMGTHNVASAIEGEVLSDSPIQIGAWESV